MSGAVSGRHLLPARLAPRGRRQRRRFEPGACARGLAAGHSARWQLRGDRQSACHRHWRLRRSPDQVDLHTWKLLKGIALATVLGVGSQLAFGSSDSDLIKALQQSTQATTNRAGQRLVERNLNVQPTISVRPGWPLRVIVHKDIVLRPYREPTSK
jgi:hypothetical protein